jgi:hypothetical protein
VECALGSCGRLPKQHGNSLYSHHLSINSILKQMSPEIFLVVGGN